MSRASANREPGKFAPEVLDLLQKAVDYYKSVLLLSFTWLSAVRTLDLQSRGCGFNSRSGHYQVATTCMDDCPQTGKPSWYVTNSKVNSTFYLSGVGKSSSNVSAWG